MVWIIKILSLSLFMNWSYGFSGLNGLERFCTDVGGHLYQGLDLRCPNTNFPILTKVCHFTNRYNEPHFTDGCTGPTGGFRDTLLSSCVKHDLCYHHEPASNGLTQEDCDEDFKLDALRACQNERERDRCERVVIVMYKALKAGGSLAYRCDNSGVISYDL